MIQELIYTSVPKGLEPDSQGFCTVAQTVGTSPPLSQAMKLLSGYRHIFPIGDERKPFNPSVFMHVIRRVGGVDLHIVSRVSDCGVDYTHRSNLIAHHLAFEERDWLKLQCDPLALFSLAGLFKTSWQENPHEIATSPKIPSVKVMLRRCDNWERQLGDAGWGGVLAERIERGDPVSLIFDPKIKVAPLLEESFAILPLETRWKTTFSTFFMKSQEPPNANKIQIKCILAGSDEEAYKKLTPNTLVIDLRQKQTTEPTGIYVETARTGIIEKLQNTLPVNSQNETKEQNIAQKILTTQVSVPTKKKKIHVNIPHKLNNEKNKKTNIIFRIIWIIVPIIIILTLAALTVNYIININEKRIEQKAKDEKEKIEKERKEIEAKIKTEKFEKERKETEAKIEAEKIEKERKENEAKIEAEKIQNAEKKRKETEQIEKEKKQKELEAKTKANEKLKKQIENLPDALESFMQENRKSQTLKNSSFLWNVKDKVIISYTSFITPDANEIKCDKNKITIDKKNDKGHNFAFIINDEKKPVFTIELKEEGLCCQWNYGRLSTDTDRMRLQNRILLAKLKVEIKGTELTKNVALLAPVKNTEVNIKKFTLWQQNNPSKNISPNKIQNLSINGEQNGGQNGAQNRERTFLGKNPNDAEAVKQFTQNKEQEFIIYKNEVLNLLLDFNEFITPDGKRHKLPDENKEKIKRNDSLGYARQITYSAITGDCRITCDNDFNFKVEFLYDEYENRSKQKNEYAADINNEKKNKTEIELKIKECQTKIKEAETFIAKNNGNLTQQQSQNNLQNAQKIIQDNKIIIEQLNNNLKEQNKKIQNTENKIKNINEELKTIKEQWDNIKLNDLSIYLIKNGTKKEDIDKPENKLLLFEVKN
jgi:hypothetical protein